MKSRLTFAEFSRDFSLYAVCAIPGSGADGNLSGLRHKPYGRRFYTGLIVPVQAGSMAEYRAYFVGNDDHFRNVRVLDCPDDDTAIAEAKKLLNGVDIELWQLGRKVARLDHKKK